MAGLIERFLSPAPRAETSWNPSPTDDFWYSSLGALGNGPISVELALQLDMFFACVRVLTESVGILPFILHRRLEDGGKERATDDPRYNLLRWQPDGRTTAQSYWEMVVLHMLLRGAHTAVKVRGRDGVLERLVPLHPDRVKAEETESGRIVYHYRDLRGVLSTYRADQVFRVTFLTMDGMQPLSVLSAAARAVRLGLEAEHYAQAAFTNDPTSQLAIINKTGFKTTEARAKFRESLVERGTGANRHKPLVIEGDGDVKQLSLSMEDLQLLQTRLFEGRSIARVMRVPLHMVGDLERSTNNNIEHQGIEFVTLDLSPWLVRIEQAVKLQLFTDEPDLSAEFLTDALVRGDMKSRYEAHASSLTTGWKTVNEVRATENLNPIEGGNELREPLNMARVGPADRRTQQIAMGQARRVARQEAEGLAKLAKQHANDGAAWRAAVGAFYDAHRLVLVRDLRLPVAAADGYCTRQRAAVLATPLNLELHALAAEEALQALILEDDDGRENTPSGAADAVA